MRSGSRSVTSARDASSVDAQGGSGIACLRVLHSVPGPDRDALKRGAEERVRGTVGEHAREKKTGGSAREPPARKIGKYDYFEISSFFEMLWLPVSRR